MKYMANDGKIFDTETECRDYEIMIMNTKRKDKLIAFGGYYSRGNILIGDMLNNSFFSSISSMLESATIIYIPENIYNTIIENKGLPIQGLTIGLNVWDEGEMCWINTKDIIESYKKQIERIEEIMEYINEDE